MNNNIKTDKYELNNVNKINVLLGKNGSGKSTILRNIKQWVETHSSNSNTIYKNIEYIIPQRGGQINKNLKTEMNMQNDKKFASNQRNTNELHDFKQQSISKLYELAMKIWKIIDQDRSSERSVDKLLTMINKLLNNININFSDNGRNVEISSKDNKNLTPAQISSGESEIIALVIECLHFIEFNTNLEEDKKNILLLDEPDVHLHPDLQVKFIKFLRELVNDNKSLIIIIATHSTAILGALADDHNASFALIKNQDYNINFQIITQEYTRILPIFGAHPLSNLFNEKPILLVEGEDDERIWQQVVRTSDKQIKLYPCGVDTIDQLNHYEQIIQSILLSVYDTPKAYSLRDGDDKIGQCIDDLPPITRMRLNCYSAENLLLTNEVLLYLKIDFEQLKIKINDWVQKHDQHKHIKEMRNFMENPDYNRQHLKVKEIRNDLLGIIGTSKPWEVAVGQTIARLTWNDNTNFESDGSIFSFMGRKVAYSLLISLKQP
jgi:predicted ATP-dependent endonuclease of OLD family